MAEEGFPNKMNTTDSGMASFSSPSSVSSLPSTLRSASSSPPSSAGLSSDSEDHNTEATQLIADSNDDYFSRHKMTESAPNLEEDLKELVVATNVKRGLPLDVECTPRKIAKKSPACKAPTKLSLEGRAPFKSRQIKAFRLQKKINRNVFTYYPKGRVDAIRECSSGTSELVQEAVREGMKSFETVVRSLLQSLQQDIAQSIHTEIQHALDEFKSTMEDSLQKSTRKPRQRRVKSEIKSTSSSSTGEGNRKKEEDDENKVGATTIDSQNAEDNKSSTIPSVKVDDNEPCILNKKKSAFDALLKHARSATLVDTLKAMISKQEENANFDTSDKEMSESEESCNDSDPGSPVSIFSLSEVQQEVMFSQDDYSKVCSTPAKTETDFEKKPDKPTCTALVTYVKPSPTTPTPKSILLDLRQSEGELILKPELGLGKQKLPMKCEYCGKHFYNNSSLKQHISFHRPNRPFECTESGCGKAYKTRSELNRHCVVHSGLKKFECNSCGKRFLRKQYLKTHLLRHEEPLTWQCDLCTKIFVNKDDLNKHRVSYHKHGKARHPERLAFPALKYPDSSVESITA